MRTPLTLGLTLLLAAPAAAASPTPTADVAPATPDGTNPACVGGDRQPGNGGADVAVNAAGDAVVTWTHNAGGGEQVVQAAVRPAGGTFGPPEPVGTTLPCSVFGVAGPTPQAGIDRAGDVIVAFGATAGANPVIRAAVRPAGGRFGTPVDLSDGAQRADGAPRLAMNEDGVAAVVWSRFNGARDVVQAAVRPPGGSFAPAANLSGAAQNARGPSVAVNADGAVAVAWTRETAGTSSPTRAQATVRPAGAAGFVGAQDLSGTVGTAREADVGVDAAGRVLATWLRQDGQTDVAESGGLTAQGVVAGGVDPVSEPGEDPSALRLAVDPTGRAVAAYVRCGAGPCVVRAALRPAGERFATPETVSPPVNFDHLVRVAIAPDGAATVLVDGNFSGERILLAHRPAGGGFADVVPVSPAGTGAFAAALAVDGEGNAVAAWTAAASVTAPKTVQAGALDAAPPSLTDVDVPATAAAGETVAMRASARDRWSGAELAWDFGDGATAAGAEAAHAFGPGTHRVTVTATDAAGNRATESRTISVSAAAVPPAPGAPPVVRSPVQTRWAVNGKRLVLLSLRIAQPPAGARAQLRCRGGRCPFPQRTVQRRVGAKGALVVFRGLALERALATPARRFRAGQRLQLRVTAAGAVGKVVRFRLRAGRSPRGEVSCLPPGARAPEACPQ